MNKIPETNFSLILPLYNGSSTISLVIKSIIGQEYKNFELILYDDCSTDNSLAIAENMLKQSSIKFTIIKGKKNRGTFFGWNEGVKKALGDYIIITPQDNVMVSDRLAVLNETIIKKNYPLLITSDLYEGTLENFFLENGRFKACLSRTIAPTVTSVFLLKSSLFDFDNIVVKKDEYKVFPNLEKFSPAEDFAFVSEVLKKNKLKKKNLHVHLKHPLVYKIKAKNSQSFFNANRIAKASILYIKDSDQNFLVKYFSIKATANIALMRGGISKNSKKNFKIDLLGFFLGASLNFFRLLLVGMLSFLVFSPKKFFKKF